MSKIAVDDICSKWDIKHVDILALHLIFIYYHHYYLCNLSCFYLINIIIIIINYYHDVHIICNKTFFVNKVIFFLAV